MKHDNVCTYDGFQWNWSRTALNDDCLFVASCINHAIANEITWPDEAERARLGRMNTHFSGCIGIIDGTLVRIRHPYKNPDHAKWFNGRKKMYCMNNTVVVSHEGLFLHVDLGFPGSYHDVTILRHSHLFRNWRHHFTHTDEYFEYLLGDPGYLGESMFIMRRLGTHERPPDADDLAITTYNKMHAGYRVQVEWGIGGLKRKWRHLMCRFDTTKPKYHHLFRACALLTNFLHRRRMDFNNEVVGEHNENAQNHGWDGDY